MQKTPDEIKKGLEGLKFIANAGRIDDALALIQQLKAENAQLNRCIENMTDKLNAAHDEAAKLQAERDAAVKSLRGRCFECKNNKTSVCLICSKEKNLKYWKWRGVQKEDSNETT